jgi:hypothetical protein
LLSICVVPFSLLIRALYIIILSDFKELLEASLMNFFSNFTLVIIPRVECSIFIFTQHFDREYVNGSKEGFHKVMIEVFNIFLIRQEI